MGVWFSLLVSYRLIDVAPFSICIGPRGIDKSSLSVAVAC
jgi:hypothetical protein